MWCLLFITEPCMPMIKGGNIRKNTYILFKNEPHFVTKTEFVSPGKGSAFTRARLKSMKTLNTIEFTFKSTETVEELEVNTRQMQFLYADQDNVAFMDPRTYEQIEIPRALIEDKLGYLTSDSEVYILFYNDEAIGVRVPLKVKLKVTYAENATAGNRVNAPKKPVTLETGLVVQAPLFTKVGDVLIIDTETGEYVSRANE
jgi:elongation factor P